MIVLVTGCAEELQAAVEDEAKKIAEEEARLLHLALAHWLIFLDFDGVLNHEEFFKQREAHGQKESFDRECVARLNKLILALDAVVVISSAWRQGHSLSELREILEAHGFVGTIIGKTPARVPVTNSRFSKRIYGQRGDEIQTWLDVLPQKTNKFIVLDDYGDMDAVRSHFVQTHADKGGLTDKKVEEALRLAERLVR